MSILYLVGAGPGDPELITLKAVKCLQAADVILYDALVNVSLLSHASKTCKKVFVGKRYGCHSLSQSEINALIMDYSSAHENIVRLKGGDPFVFGRAQEEIEAAVQCGMNVAVVPGISSAMAVPASQMIPVTCRGVSESFWVLTGTTRNGEISGDMILAAQSSATVIILMAMSRLEAITEVFKRYGKGNTPAAVIQNGTTLQCCMVKGKVNDIFFKAAHAGLANPAVIIIGEVVNLHHSQVLQQVSPFLKKTCLNG